MKEIFILCNSAECLREISSGKFKELHTKDIFTCNNAFTFFRTSGKHFNMMVDIDSVNRIFQFPEMLSDNYRARVFFTVAPFNFNIGNLEMLKSVHNFSSVNVGSSSAIAALFYLNAEFDYDVIHLIGYTLTEDHPGAPEEKKKEFQKVYANYSMEKVSDNVFKYTRKVSA